MAPRIPRDRSYRWRNPLPQWLRNSLLDLAFAVLLVFAGYTLVETFFDMTCAIVRVEHCDE